MVKEPPRISSHPASEWLERYPEPVQGASGEDAYQLVRWLQGDDGATAGESVDPPVWILRAVDDAVYPGRVRRQLALHCRSLLEQRPDRMLAEGNTRAFRRPGQYLHNLLRLCSELPEPEILRDPLLAIYRDNVLPERGDGYGMIDPLRAALIRNQLGPELEDEWFAMLRGDPSRLGSTRVSGLRGVIAMPQSSETLGRPWTLQIARALGEMARYMEKFRDKKREMRLLVSEAQEPFGGALRDYDLMTGAIESDWPVWAVEANWLCVSAPGANAKQTGAYLWRYIADCIPESYRYRRLHYYFEGAFVQVELSGKALKYVNEIAPTFEESVLGNPFPSRGARNGVLSFVMDQLERRMRSKGNRVAAAAILRVRERVLSPLYSATLALHSGKPRTIEEDSAQIGAKPWATHDAARGWIEELRAR